MLPNQYTPELLKKEIYEDCTYLLAYCCNADIANQLLAKYDALRLEFLQVESLRGVELGILCWHMLFALRQVIRHGDIISVSYADDLVTVVYADGFISSIMNLLAHYYSVESPECTYVDMEDPSTDKGFRVLITNDEYIAFAFCCNCYAKVPENIKNLSYLLAPFSDFLIDVARRPNICRNKYGLYTDSEYHFTSTL